MMRLSEGQRDIIREQEADAREAEEHPCRHRGRHWSAAHGAWCEWSEESGACLPIPSVQTDDDDLPF